MAVAEDKQAGAVAWAKRLWPLLLLLAAMALVFAMGWHRYLTLQELVERREALRASIAGHTLLAILAFMAIYAATVALSLPGAAVLTLAGGFLFGWFWGALASVAAATTRRHRHLPHRPERARRAACRPRRAMACEAPRRIQGGCFQLSPIPAPRPHLPVLARQSRPGASRRRPSDLRACHSHWYHSGKFCLFHRRQRARQSYRCSASGAPILPCQDGIRCGRVMPVRARA